MSRQIYMDFNATTPVDPEVVGAMTPYFTEKFGNASSVHGFGRVGKSALENARETAADLLGCEPAEIVFTAGGTEGDNLCVKGAVRALKSSRATVVTSAIEHSAVRDAARALSAEGCVHREVAVTNEGFVTPQALRESLDDTVGLVSIMHANNEIGVIQDLAALADIAHEQGALFHTDAVQSFGKIPVLIPELGVDLLTISGHKFYAPKGVGLIFVRSGIKIHSLVHGGGQEKGRRTGTENIPLIVGLVTAMKLAIARQEEEYRRLSILAERFIGSIESSIPAVSLNGPRLVAGKITRTPSTINLSFSGVEGEPLLLSLDLEGVAVSSGSACHAGAVDPSHVLTAIGCPLEVAKSSIRFSFGRATTTDDVTRVADLLPGIVERLRRMSPSYARATR